MAVPLLTARGLGKRYAAGRRTSLVDLLRRKDQDVETWSLRDVDLDVAPGEVVSVIGRNGAGKSTLLKLCAGVTRPTVGSLSAPRRIAPLIEVGAGFHPDLSGRENVEVNARLLGLTARQVRERFDSIVAFAELASSIDMPVRQYSSGMFMRLGFSVAVHTDPELLIVDEVLAVGDLPFQMRCMERIATMRETGVGVLFVSHNLGAVLNLSDRAVFLDGGRVHTTGAPGDVVAAYHQSLGTGTPTPLVGGDAIPGGSWDLADVEVRDAEGGQPSLWRSGDVAVVHLDLVARAGTPRGVIVVGLNSEAQQISRWVGSEGPFVPPLQAGQHVRLAVRLDLHVPQGSYPMDVGILPDKMGGSIRFFPSVARFEVAGRPGASGLVELGTRVEFQR